MKMESLEFYAELLYKATMLGGAKEFNQEQVTKLYEIRRKMGLTGRHPADFVGQQIPGSEQTGTARNIMDELADKVAGKVLAKLNAQK